MTKCDIRLDLLRETLEDYESVRKTLTGLPPMSLVAVHREHEQVAMDERLFKRMTKIGTDKHGWARFRSELGWTGCWPNCFKQSGPPIMAEWVVDDDGACRLTPAPSTAGNALIVSIREREIGPDGLGENEIPALREKLKVLAHPRVESFTHAAYHVYWGLPPRGSSSATRRLFDRFAGFLEKMEG